MKPLGHKAYGSIPHLPNSRMGPADHHCSPGQARIATEKPRDKYDTITVQEKLDGSCCAVYRKDNKFYALTRSGYLAETSPFQQHHLFAHWVKQNEDRFDKILNDGERVIGEWLAQAHGTIYKNLIDPFVPFDIMTGNERMIYSKFFDRVLEQHFFIPACVHSGKSSYSIEWAMKQLGEFGFHGAQTPIEGAVWRVERKGKVDFLVKYVRPDKKDGIYLPEISGKDPVWNWGVGDLIKA